MAALGKPDGWYLDMLSIAPDRAGPGERNLAVLCFGIDAAGTLALCLHGGSPAIVIAIGGGFFVVSWLLIYRAWLFDPWLSRVYARFKRYPACILAHASSASSEMARAFERNRKHFAR